MEDENNVGLYANIIFNLFLQAMNNKYESGDNFHKDRKRLTQTEMFFDLNNL